MLRRRRRPGKFSRRYKIAIEFRRKIQVEIGGHLVTVKGNVENGIVSIGTVYIPWTR